MKVGSTQCALMGCSLLVSVLVSAKFVRVVIIFRLACLDLVTVAVRIASTFDYQ